MTEIPPPLPQQPDSDAEALRRPTTSAAELARIAAQRPDLHPAIAAHPSCYPDLATWITEQASTAQTQLIGDQELASPEETAQPEADQKPSQPEADQEPASPEETAQPEADQKPDQPESAREPDQLESPQEAAQPTDASQQHDQTADSENPPVTDTQESAQSEDSQEPAGSVDAQDVSQQGDAPQEQPVDDQSQAVQGAGPLSQPDSDAEALRRPTTSAAELARIAAQRPDLHPAIAAHPSCYPDLATWITEQASTAQTQPASDQELAQSVTGAQEPVQGAGPLSQPDSDAEALRRPTTSAAELARIAAQRPDLHPAIAAHPSCYPDLATWITEQASTAQTQLIGARQAGQSAAGFQGSAAQLAGYRIPAQSTGISQQPSQPPSPGIRSDQPAKNSNASSRARRRSVIKVLSIGIGAAAVGALVGTGTWWVTQRSGSEDDDQAASGPFSMSALEGTFLQGTRETWNIAEGRSTVSMSPDGAHVVALCPKLAESDFSYEPRVYPLDADALGTPVVFPADQMSKSNSEYSVVFSWWSGSPLIWDSIYDASSSLSSPVPWDTASTVFLGAPSKKRAILLEAPHVFDKAPSAPPQGAMISVDGSGKELWRTSDEYVSGFFDPARSDLLIGYKNDGDGNDSKSMTMTPHLLDPKTGSMRAALSPLVFDDSGKKSGGLLLASDGLVCFSNDGSTMTAEAYTFDGQSAWSLTGGFAKIVFCGVPSLDVANQALTAQDGSTSLIAENGTALVQASNGNFSLAGTGTALKLGKYDAESAELADFSYFTMLSDGSGILAQDSKKDDSIRMIDTSTGADAWSLSGQLMEDGLPQNQSTVKALPRSTGGVTRNGPSPAGIMLVSSGTGLSATVTCFAPGS